MYPHVYSVEDVAAESRVLMARALEEAEEEMRCKAELIRQIRAMERVPVARTRLVDLTATGKLGLLVEMSVAELRERLVLLRVAEEEEEERKRKEIAASKQVLHTPVVCVCVCVCGGDGRLEVCVISSCVSGCRPRRD